MDKSKLERLKKISAAINKTVKDADVQYLGNEEAAQLVRITSQAPSLDGIIGGGWPMGRLVEIYGGESTGKTTLCYHALNFHLILNMPTEWVLRLKKSLCNILKMVNRLLK